MGLNVIFPLVGGLAVLGVLVTVVLVKKRTAYLGPVKEELQKEKMWLRRGEYNAAMVKGRQNLELLLKLVAEKNGIQLDNTAQAVANAREEEERQSQNGHKKRGGRKKEKKVMTHHQFNRWLAENGYLDRVAKWEMNQVRLIGNKAVHENYADKDDAWNQYNYLEDILKTVTEKSQNPKKHHERKGAEKQTETGERHPGGQKNQGERHQGGKKKQGDRYQEGQKNQGERHQEGQKNQDEKTHQSARKRQNRQKDGKKVTDAKSENVAKSEKKPQTQNVPVAAAASVPAETEALEQKHKKRRRRRKKKPQAEVAPAAAVVVEEKPVNSAPSASVPKEQEHKKRRRRRRKPQAKSAEGAAGTAIVPEDKNESI